MASARAAGKTRSHRVQRRVVLCDGHLRGVRGRNSVRIDATRRPGVLGHLARGEALEAEGEQMDHRRAMGRDECVLEDGSTGAHGSPDCPPRLAGGGAGAQGKDCGGQGGTRSTYYDIALGTDTARYI